MTRLLGVDERQHRLVFHLGKCGHTQSEPNIKLDKFLSSQKGYLAFGVVMSIWKDWGVHKSFTPLALY